MLISCIQCEQVIEIATLNEHLVEECEYAHKYKKFEGSAILTEDYEQHQATSNWKELKIINVDVHYVLRLF